MLKQEDALELARRMRTSLKIQNEIGFGDMNIKPPDIDFYADNDQFFDPNNYEIHIGVLGILTLFKVNSEEAFLNALNYVRGHEEQHVRSTATRPYELGINMGTQAVLEYISMKEEKSKRRFRNESDYIDFVNRILPSLGLHISMDMIRQIIAGIANSIEDGRIERIRSVRFPGFEKLRIVHRGIFWQDGCPKKPYEEIKDEPGERLTVILNEILSLATCQLYTKGFIAAYAGTPIVAEVNAMMPHIALGVMAARTRDMATQVVEIAKKLAPYIYEVVKLSEKDVKARQALEKILADMIKNIVDKMPANNLSEQDEDTEDDMGNATFPMSDLVVTLPDDVYDKMVEKSKKSGKQGGLMVQREHPKEESEKKENGQPGQTGEKKSDRKSSDQHEKAGEGQKSGKSGSGSEAEDETGNGSSGKQKDSPGKDGSSGSDSGKGDADMDSESETGTSGKGENADSSSEKAGKGSSGDKADDAGRDEDEDGSGTGDGSGSSGRKGSKSRGEQDGSDTGNEGSVADTEKASKSSDDSMGTGKDRDHGAKGIKGENAAPSAKGSMEEVLKAMKEAAEEVNEKAKTDISNVNATSAHEARTKVKETPDTSKPITAEDVKGICPNFEELRRQYRLTEKLPAVQMARGKSLLRKNQKYFKSLSTPNVSFLDSGSVDPGRIYGLAFGDTEIFRRKGMDKKFDGCAYILLDNSGSMAGNKRREACKAAAVIEEGFRGLIPIKIVAFDYWHNVIHEVIKGWDEQQTLNCCWNFCVKGRQGGGNADGYDIMIATKELLARPEQKKLLLVLSDGMPAEASPGFTKGAIQAARRRGIQVSGIYFEEGRVGHEARQFLSMYGDGTDSRDAVACSLNELDDHIEKIMKRFSRS